ncbi:MAG: hypothetical protein HC788_14740 [Sphingopyxis sp.]|nr:hypothetical protein [Sphingopyxis sp.]
MQNKFAIMRGIYVSGSGFDSSGSGEALAELLSFDKNAAKEAVILAERLQKRKQSFLAQMEEKPATAGEIISETALSLSDAGNSTAAAIVSRFGVEILQGKKPNEESDEEIATINEGLIFTTGLAAALINPSDIEGSNLRQIDKVRVAENSGLDDVATNIFIELVKKQKSKNDAIQQSEIDDYQSQQLEISRLLFDSARGQFCGQCAIWDDSATVDYLLNRPIPEVFWRDAAESTAMNLFIIKRRFPDRLNEFLNRYDSVALEVFGRLGESAPNDVEDRVTLGLAAAAAPAIGDDRGNCINTVIKGTFDCLNISPGGGNMISNDFLDAGQQAWDDYSKTLAGLGFAKAHWAPLNSGSTTRSPKKAQAPAWCLIERRRSRR